MKNTKFTENEKKDAKNKLNDDMRNQINLLEEFINKNHGMDDITEINIMSLKKYIKNAKKGNGSHYSDAWKKKMMFALKVYYDELGKPIKAITNDANKLFKQIKATEEKQEQTQKEKDNYLSYDELNILLKEYENYTTKNKMNLYLIFASICTDQPPLRPQIYANLKIIYDAAKIDKTGKENYLVIDEKKKGAYLYINDDKVYKFHSEKKEIKIQPIFYKIIVDSLDKYDRENFLDYGSIEDIEKKMLYELQKATGNKFNFDMARSAYISNWYSTHPDPSYENKKELAEMMRHTPIVQEIYYKKKLPVSGNLDKILEQKRKKEEEIKQEESENKYKKINKIRAVISMANTRMKTDENSKIKEETIEKYGIQQRENGEYFIPKQKIKKEKETKQLKGDTDLNDPDTIKKRNDVIRIANKKIDNGIPTQIREQTKLHYKIVLNPTTHRYE